jgi:hypothetical protein
MTCVRCCSIPEQLQRRQRLWLVRFGPSEIEGHDDA